MTGTVTSLGRGGTAAAMVSGVTRVGATRGGNWGCHPYFFLKNWLPFLLITVVTFIDFIRVSPLWRVSPRTIFTYPTSFVHCSL